MRILVVDDDEFIRSIVAEIIVAMGWEAQTCANGQEALEHLLTGQYSLMFLDLIMPNLDGVDTLKEIQKRGIEIDTVVISGKLTNEMRDLCEKYGAKRFLDKPLEVSDIDNVLKEEKKTFDGTLK